MRKTAIVLFLAAGVLAAIWLTQGRHLATLTEKPIRTVATDDFGDQVETVTWESTLEPGLDVALPGIFGLTTLGLVLLMPERRRTAMSGKALLVVGALAIVAALASGVIAYTG